MILSCENEVCVLVCIKYTTQVLLYERGARLYLMIVCYKPSPKTVALVTNRTLGQQMKMWAEAPAYKP